VSQPAYAIRRVLVALEAGTGAPPDMEAIVALAERLHAEILGLVVEDVNLLRSASLPFVHQVSLLTGAEEPFEVEWVERAMHRSAADVETRLGRAAAARDVRWTLRVVRGSVVDQVLAAVQEGDLLVIEAQPAPRYVAAATADPAAAAARRARRPVLIVRPGAHLVGGPVLVVFDGTEDAVTALQFAAQMAGDGDAVVEVALLAPAHDQRVALEAAAREALLGFAGIVRLHRLTDADPRRACALAHRLGSAILFVGAECALLRERGLTQVLDELRCPVWVVR
jgi:hypothetical protein